MRDKIITAMARAGYAMQWADAVEEARAEGRDDELAPCLSGREIMDVLPLPIPADFTQWAHQLCARIEANNALPIGEAFRRACAAPCAHSWEDKADVLSDKDAVSFGHYLAMQAMGSGVRWSDSHPEHGLKIPYEEAPIYILPSERTDEPLDVYVYAADLHCTRCGEKLREDLTREGRAPADPEDEKSYDSDNFPKGPYADGGGESDAPQHCGTCGRFLGNPLTADGVAYLKEALREKRLTGKGETVEEWTEFYRHAFLLDI